jgi:hypothetical protein
MKESLVEARASRVSTLVTIRVGWVGFYHTCNTMETA